MSIKKHYDPVEFYKAVGNAIEWDWFNSETNILEKIITCWAEGDTQHVLVPQDQWELNTQEPEVVIEDDEYYDVEILTEVIADGYKYIFTKEKTNERHYEPAPKRRVKRERTSEEGSPSGTTSRAC